MKGDHMLFVVIALIVYANLLLPFATLPLIVNNPIIAS